MLTDIGIKVILAMLFILVFNVDIDLQRDYLNEIHNTEVMSFSYYPKHYAC